MSSKIILLLIYLLLSGFLGHWGYHSVSQKFLETWNHENFPNSMLWDAVFHRMGFIRAKDLQVLSRISHLPIRLEKAGTVWTDEKRTVYYFKDPKSGESEIHFLYLRVGADIDKRWDQLQWRSLGLGWQAFLKLSQDTDFIVSDLSEKTIEKKKHQTFLRDHREIRF